jgi:hypothetical protein
MLAGIAGTYRKHETVDVQFTRSGKVELASDLPIHAQAAQPADPHEGRSH